MHCWGDMAKVRKRTQLQSLCKAVRPRPPKLSLRKSDPALPSKTPAMNDTLISRFSQTVESIHSAALQPHHWPTALERIATLQHAERTLLFTPKLNPQDGGFVLAHDISETMLSEWALHYSQHDLWTARTLSNGSLEDGDVVMSHELVPDAEFLSSVFYREFLLRQNIRHMCCGIIFSGRSNNLPLTGCSVFRPGPAKVFDPQSRSTHALITRHLSLALGTVMRLRDSEFKLATSLHALDRLHTSVLLIGPRGNVTFANRNALDLLEQGLGLRLQSGHPLADGLGWLVASVAAEQALLGAETRAALANDPLRPAHFSHGMAICGPSGNSQLTVHTVPVAQASSALWSPSITTGALVFITNAGKVPQLEPAFLLKIYGITGAECRVAQQVLHGQTVQEMAQRLHLAENTVKTHLKRLFEKTNTKRQAELIHLLITLVQQY